MNSKGQGFDVFKLLIAAVVAAAILVILLNILRPIVPPVGNEPSSVATSNVKTAVNDIGLPKLTDKVVFEKESSLNSRTIASNTGSLSEEQVCVIKTSSTPNATNFSENNGKVLIYNGSSGQQARLLILCDRQSKIGESIETYSYNEKYGLDSSLSDCEFPATTESIVCLVAVVSD